VDEEHLRFLLFVYSTHKSCTTRLLGRDNLQCARINCFTAVTDVMKELCNYLICDFLLGRN